METTAKCCDFLCTNFQSKHTLCVRAEREREGGGWGLCAMESREADEEETFRVDCAEEEAWTLAFLRAEPVAVLLH